VFAGLSELEAGPGAGTMAKAWSPALSAAIALFGSVIGLCVNVSTLPVPSHVQNDWANAGVAKVASAARVVRNFFMSFLLVESGRCGPRTEETEDRMDYSWRFDPETLVLNNVFMKQD
jgi:hypothetical protein